MLVLLIISFNLSLFCYIKTFAGLKWAVIFSLNILIAFLPNNKKLKTFYGYIIDDYIKIVILGIITIIIDGILIYTSLNNGYFYLLILGVIVLGISIIGSLAYHKQLKALDILFLDSSFTHKIPTYHKNFSIFLKIISLLCLQENPLILTVEQDPNAYPSANAAASAAIDPDKASDRNFYPITENNIAWNREANEPFVQPREENIPFYWHQKEKVLGGIFGRARENMVKAMDKSSQPGISEQDKARFGLEATKHFEESNRVLKKTARLHRHLGVFNRPDRSWFDPDSVDNIDE